MTRWQWQIFNCLVPVEEQLISPWEQVILSTLPSLSTTWQLLRFKSDGIVLSCSTPGLNIGTKHCRWTKLSQLFSRVALLSRWNRALPIHSLMEIARLRNKVRVPHGLFDNSGSPDRLSSRDFPGTQGSVKDKTSIPVPRITTITIKIP